MSYQKTRELMSLRYKVFVVTLCFTLCICTVATGAANCCTKNIRLMKLFLVMIEAHDAPHILVGVVVAKKNGHQ